MNRLSVLLSAVVLLPLVGLSTGCQSDCQTYCARQARYIDQCLPEFDEDWSDLNSEWSGRSDFVAECNSMIDDHIEADIEESCANAAEGADRRECEQLVRQSANDVCAEDFSKFQQSCTRYWSTEVDFLPGDFERPPYPQDDDDSAGDDDDDSAGDDDDDSAGDDDDDDSAGDDDDSAGDDDDSAGDDDDSAGDDDDSAGDDDDSAI